MGRIEKTVFISYRRRDEPWALAVFADLTQHGYDVFIDYDGIGSGSFETAILENIKARAHFLVLLTPTALERCADPKDWMRREIETAVESQRNIVPLILAGFNFGAPASKAQLVGKLGTLPSYNGLPIPEGYFPQAMERLRNKFLNVPVDAVLHPASVSAQQIATKQKDRARVALEAAAIEDREPRSVPRGASDQPIAEPPTKTSAADIAPLESARVAPKQPERKEPTSWFTTKVKALTPAIVAVAAVIAAGKPIVEVLQPFACGTLRLCGSTAEPPASSDTAVLKGTSGWIYAGTQVDGVWKITAEEGIEPAVTIDSGETPVTGKVYKLIRPVFLRVSAPLEAKDGTRPEMPDSKGKLEGGRSVKVDKLQPIDLKDPRRTWIWAHVTVVD